MRLSDGVQTANLVYMFQRNLQFAVKFTSINWLNKNNQSKIAFLKTKAHQHVNNCF